MASFGGQQVCFAAVVPDRSPIRNLLDFLVGSAYYSVSQLHPNGAGELSS